MKKGRREEIIKIAMDIFRSRGYNNVSTSDLLILAGIPKGSFYYYFSNKEDLVRQAITCCMTNMVFELESYPETIHGLREFFRGQAAVLVESDYQNGYPFDSFTTELTGISEDIRRDVVGVLQHVTDYVKKALGKSLQLDELTVNEYTTFIISSFQGAVIRAKLECTDKALNNFDKLVFDLMLPADRQAVVLEIV